LKETLFSFSTIWSFAQSFFKSLLVSFNNSLFASVLFFSRANNSNSHIFFKANSQTSLSFEIFVDFFSLIISLYICFNFSFFSEGTF
jgi:hypothetical protein